MKSTDSIAPALFNALGIDIKNAESFEISGCANQPLKIKVVYFVDTDPEKDVFLPTVGRMVRRFELVEKN